MLIEAISLAWFLQGPNTTYALAVNEQGYLVNWHWGERIRPSDLATARPMIARAFTPYPEGTPFAFSLDTILAEYPAAGGCDFRTPAIEVEHADGTRVLDLKYLSHRIVAGKPTLDGLPATYVEQPGEAETLEIELVDELGGVRVVLAYTVFAEHDAIARSVRVRNTGTSPVRILRVLSASVDLPEDGAVEWLHLSGAWGRERTMERATIRPGTQSVESRRGASSHQHNPFLAVLGSGVTEDRGEVWGMSLVYSGNFLAAVERDPLGLTRAQIGINPAGFAWHLEPGAEFQAPEAVLVYSAHGLDGLSRTCHRLYRTRLCRGKFRDAHRPVLLNNWEATYFAFDEARLVDLARRARAVGVELFVLDDGWFGRRDNDDSSLGDWTPDRRKLPDGLAGLAAKIRAEGLWFGLWFEPEMVSPDSDLFRAHPDWCLHVAGRGRTLARHQLVLDFSRPEVCDAIYAQLDSILRNAPISYVKWDMNRHLTEVASAGREPERQAETAHRHILGLYRVLERLTSAFPDVLFESCSGGGGRYDPGMLHYMPQTWTSDNTDAICRLSIQRGTTLVYPLSSMASHISAVPNHQVHRITPIATRGLVAMSGAFGLELDLARNTPEELAGIARLVALNKELSHLLRTGDLHWLKSPDERGEAAWMVVSPDKEEAFVVHVRVLTQANGPLLRLRLRGLNPGYNYTDAASGLVAAGDVLMAHGVVWPDGHDFVARSWHLKRIPAGRPEAAKRPEVQLRAAGGGTGDRILAVGGRARRD